MTWFLWLCKVIYRCKKAGARGRASAFEIFISSNYQRLLYSKGQKFHSINKASNGTRSYGEIAIKGSTEPITSRIFRFQQPLQNRVPRVQVLLPLPKRNSHHFGDCFFFVRQNLSEARACRASSPSAAGGRCSEARMAQRSKYGVTPPYFGHRKRGCEATSSPFVYLRQSCGDNYCFCFTEISLAFLL